MIDSDRVPVVILCGGRGTRMGQGRVPKPLIEIGGRPILWHIMKLYAFQGFDDFILCLGYGGDKIRETIARINGDEGWKVTFLETGLDTNTGGRIKRVEGLVDGTFMATYGDGLARLDLHEVLDTHRRKGRLATMTCVRAEMPFGLVHLGPDSQVKSFTEKPRLDERVNGGFFVFEPKIFGYLEENSVLEQEPFRQLAADGELTAYLHDDFWACMDTFKEAMLLNELWENGAPWRVWQAEHA